MAPRSEGMGKPSRDECTIKFKISGKNKKKNLKNN